MAHGQNLDADAASTLSTLRGLPAYTSRAPSVAGSDAPSIFPPPFNDSRSIAPSYNTNGSATVNAWGPQPLESHPDVYEFFVGSRSPPSEDHWPWLKWLVFSPSSQKELVKPNCPRYFGGDEVACTVALNWHSGGFFEFVNLVTY